MRENRIKTYSFPVESIIGNNMTSGTGVGTIGSHFSCFTDHSLNGDLRAIQILTNNYAKIGSLLLEVSGTGELIWSLVSGTNTGMTSEAGHYMPVEAFRHTNNTLLSGTSLSAYGTIPMFGIYKLTGSAVMGSGQGITIYYQ